MFTNIVVAPLTTAACAAHAAATAVADGGAAYNASVAAGPSVVTTTALRRDAMICVFDKVVTTTDTFTGIMLSCVRRCDAALTSL